MRIKRRRRRRKRREKKSNNNNYDNAIKNKSLPLTQTHAHAHRHWDNVGWTKMSKKVRGSGVVSFESSLKCAMIIHCASGIQRVERLNGQSVAGKTHLALNLRLINATADEWNGNYWLWKYLFATFSMLYWLLAIFTVIFENGCRLCECLQKCLGRYTLEAKMFFINVKWHINIPCWDVNCNFRSMLSQFQSVE